MDWIGAAKFIIIIHYYKQKHCKIMIKNYYFIKNFREREVVVVDSPRNIYNII